MARDRERRRRANGEGTIYQRASDGLWVGSAFVYTTAGVQGRWPVYGHSFDEVRAKLDQLKGASAGGVAVPDRTITVAGYVEVWLEQVKENKRATTWRGYESAVRLHIVPVLGKKRLDRLAAGDVRLLIAVCRQKCLCCVNGHDKHRPREKQCCGRFPSVRQIHYIHAVLRNALSNAMRVELVSPTWRSWSRCRRRASRSVGG